MTLFANTKRKTMSDNLLSLIDMLGMNQSNKSNL